MRKRLNKRLWYGDTVDINGEPVLPKLATGPDDELEGINEGEIYIHNGDNAPAMYIRTNKGRIVPIGDTSGVLGKFVTLDTDQLIKGVKTFAKEVRIGGGLLQWDAVNKAITFSSIDGTAASVAASGSVVGYATAEGLNTASIWSGFPIDNESIIEENGVFKVAEGAGGASELSKLKDVQLGMLLNKQVLTYDSVLGKWVNSVGGLDTNAIWNELAKVDATKKIDLSHIPDISSEIWKTLAIDDATKKIHISHIPDITKTIWDTLAVDDATKKIHISHIPDLSSKYVTIDTAQGITGSKTFVTDQLFKANVKVENRSIAKEVQIGSGLLQWDPVNKAITFSSIDGTAASVAASGSVVAYATAEGLNTTSIWDGFPIDNESIIEENGVFKVAEGAGGASELSKLKDVQLGMLLNKQVLSYDSVLGKWINSVGGLDTNAIWNELAKVDATKKIDLSHIPDLGGKYVTLDTNQTITGVKTYRSSQYLKGDCSIYITPVNKSIATGILWTKQNSTEIMAGIGTHTDGDSLINMYIGWGNNPYIADNNFRVNSTSLYYKNNELLHTGNYSPTLDTRYVKKTGDTMTGDLIFNQTSTTGIRQIRMQCADNDYGRIAVGGTGSNAGWMEIATADDVSEPIYVRQYSGLYTTVKRTATLLDASGNTYFPNTVQCTRFVSTVATGTSPIQVNSTTLCPNLNADMLDGYQESDFVRSWWTNSPGYNCNNFNSRPLISFTYSNNAPFSGAFIDVNVNGYGYYLGCAYGYNDGALYYRNHGVSADGGMSEWKQLANITDNVASATKLQTARTINGTSFDGTSNIVTSYWGNTRTFYINDPTGSNYNSYSVNGSGNTDMYLPSTMEGFSSIKSTNFVGNASTATSLQNSRSIWGQSFNGSSNVSGSLTSVADITMSGRINNCQQVGHSGSGLMLGNYANSGWVSVQDMKSADSTWFIYQNGQAEFKEVVSKGAVTGYYSASDMRLKNLISAEYDAMGIINTLDTFKFKWNSTAKSLKAPAFEDEYEHFGISAQQLERVSKTFIANTKINGEYLILRKEELVPLLVQAMKQLSRRIDNIERRIA